MVGPARVGAALEMIEPEVVFELAILLFDRPAAAGERDEVDERRRAGQVEQVLLPFVGRGSFAEQPPVAAPLRGPDAHRTEPRGQRTGGTGPPGHGFPRVLAGRLRNGRRGLRPRHADDCAHRLAANRDAIREPQALQAGAEVRVAPVIRIDHHAGDREARLQDRAHLRQRDAPFLAKLERRRNARRRPARRILGPGHRDVEVVRQGPRAPVGDQRTRHRHLAIADLAQRATVLPLHAHRARPLLRESRVVDRETAGAYGDDCAQVRPHARRECVMKCWSA
jgi:hypothetical protein